MSTPDHEITRDGAISLARSLIMRHDLVEYTEATRKISAPGEPIRKTQFRARICYRRTTFIHRKMDFDDPESFFIGDDENDKGHWRIGWFINPVGMKHIDGIAVPVTMNISKTTGKISDLWVEVSF